MSAPTSWTELLNGEIPSAGAPFAGISYAQTFEDLILDRIVEEVGVTNEACIDLGAGDGWYLSNVRRFLERGWSGILIDESGPHDGVIQMRIRPSTIASELDRLCAHTRPGILSIDIDGQDYWVLRSLLEHGYRPDILCCEYNGALSGSTTVPLDDDFTYDQTSYYGASLLAFESLLKRHGMRVVHTYWSRNLFALSKENAAKHSISYSRERRKWHTPYDGVRPWTTV